MKTTAVMVVLALAAGCKGKDKEPAKDPAKDPPVTPGSAAVAPPPVKPPPPVAPALKSGAELVTIFHQCNALIAAAKWDEFLAACAGDGLVVHNADDRDQPRAEIVKSLKDTRLAFPDVKLQPQLVLVNGRDVIAVVLWTGTDHGPMTTPFGEIPATRKPVASLMYQRLVFDATNRVGTEYAYFDPATMIGQLGWLPKTAPPVRPASALANGAAAQPVIAVASGAPEEQANLAVVKRSNETFNGRDAAAAMAVFADDAFESDQAAPKDSKGKAAIEASLKAFWKAFPNGTIAVASTWTAGDYVVAEGTFTGTHDGPLGALPKTGKQVAFAFAEVFKLKDGKITELWRFRNGSALAQQLGLAQAQMPAPSK